MEKYLLTLYVTLEQEIAIKQLFFTKSWKYLKEQKHLSTASEYIFTSEELESIEAGEDGASDADIPVENDGAIGTESSVDIPVENDGADGTVGTVVLAETEVGTEEIEEDVIDDSEEIEIEDCSSETVTEYVIFHGKDGFIQVEEAKTREEAEQLANAAANSQISLARKVSASPRVTSVNPSCIVKHTSTGEETYECSVCGLVCKTTIAFTVHKKLHSKEQQYKCEECGQEFKQSGHYIQHARSHARLKVVVTANVEDDEEEDDGTASREVQVDLDVFEVGGDGRKTKIPKPKFQCEICDKLFTKPGNLKVHLMGHKGIKPYSCKWCGREFTDPSNFRRHRMTHTAEYYYKCKLCDKSFRDTAHLTRHMKRHSDEKPFQCMACQQTFKEESSLNKHMKRACKKNITL